MGAILYPPKGMTMEEWLCELMCGGVEEELQDEETDDDRTD